VAGGIIEIGAVAGPLFVTEKQFYTTILQIFHFNVEILADFELKGGV